MALEEEDEEAGEEEESYVERVKKQREDTGVQMYGVQHQLAKMQTKFERTHDNFNIVSRYRVEAEKQHELLQKQYETKKEEADDQLAQRARQLEEWRAAEAKKLARDRRVRPRPRSPLLTSSASRGRRAGQQ